MQHSRIVGGSTAKRVINCPGSVALVNTIPQGGKSSSYADEGTLLHDTIADILDGKGTPESYLGRKHNDAVLTQDLIDDKLSVALTALDDIGPDAEMEYAVESRVGFGDLLPDVFGSTDFLGRAGDRAVVLDWKFGSGVAVEVEENSQLLFYAAAAMRTPETQWVFDGATEIEMVIVQPPSVKRWVTTPERVAAFEAELVRAVKIALKPDAPLASGDHCKWCAAKPVCPLMTGAVDRIVKAKLDALPAEQIAHYLEQIPAVESFLKDLQQLAHRMIEDGKAVPGWKLVPKRATRKWIDDTATVAAFLESNGIEPYIQKLPTITDVEKVLKKAKVELPAALAPAVSSGSTLAPESDPRPAVLQIGHTLAKAMAKIQ
jgi:hypothetical protein